MGREYFGDIEGKFWFAVQSSNDADYFGGQYSFPHRFYGCGCIVENMENNYCKDCFRCFDEHYEHYTEFDEIEEEGGVTDKNLIYQDKNVCQYQFKKENLPNVKKILKKLENEYGELITHFSIEDSNGIRYDVTYLSELKYFKYENEDTMRKVENIARICLGRQIVYCLQKYDSCNFVAEL
jgi:hypothetical protein